MAVDLSATSFYSDIRQILETSCKRVYSTVNSAMVDPY